MTIFTKFVIQCDEDNCSSTCEFEDRPTSWEIAEAGWFIVDSDNFGDIHQCPEHKTAGE